MKTKVRNTNPIMRKGGAHTKSKKTDRAKAKKEINNDKHEKL